MAPVPVGHPSGTKSDAGPNGTARSNGRVLGRDVSDARDSRATPNTADATAYGASGIANTIAAGLRGMIDARRVKKPRCPLRALLASPLPDGASKTTTTT